MPADENSNMVDIENLVSQIEEIEGVQMEDINYHMNSIRFKVTCPLEIDDIKDIIKLYYFNSFNITII